MAHLISKSGHIQRACLECGRWIGTRGYSNRIHRHKLPSGGWCGCSLGATGDGEAISNESTAPNSFLTASELRQLRSLLDKFRTSAALEGRHSKDDRQSCTDLIGIAEILEAEILEP